MSFRFDIALSFAGSDRATAFELRNELLAAKFCVFYDHDYEHEMLGRDGIEYLRRIYSQESRYCIVLISKQYDSREWARLEREAIQARELHGEHGVIIPVKLDDHHPDWLPVSRIHFDLSSRPMADLVRLVKARYELDVEALPQVAMTRNGSFDVTGRWRSVEAVSKEHGRRGIVALSQRQDEISGKADYTETFFGHQKRFILDLQGLINLKNNTIRYTGALVSVEGDEFGTYSVDKFSGKIIDANHIEGTCVDERGISGRFDLSRIV